jgi:hypothetical protein
MSVLSLTQVLRGHLLFLTVGFAFISDEGLFFSVAVLLLIKCGMHP